MYDKEKGIKKINDKFTFEKEIYIDRTLDENKALFLKVRDQVQKLREIVKSFEEAIRQIKNYNNSDINLLAILSQSKNFLLSQTEKPIEFEGNLELIKPTFIGIENEKELNVCVEMMEKYKNSLEKRLFELEVKLNDLNKEIEDSYEGLRKIKYKLLSILIHEGSAGIFCIIFIVPIEYISNSVEYGHYYSYICDFQQNKWRKYNDSHIIEVNEEELLKEAIGFLIFSCKTM